MPRLPALFCQLVLCLLIVTPPAVAEQEADDRLLLSASSREHIWFIDDTAERPMLKQHALDMQGPHFSRTVSMSRTPEALAAWGSRVWIVFPPRLVGDDLRREVFTLQVVRDPAIGLYTPEPRDRLALVDSLPGWGRLAGFAAGARGPVALLAPLQHEMIDVRRDGRPEPPPKPKRPQLFEMRGDRWYETPLPSGSTFSGDRHPLHIAIDADGTRLNLISGVESAKSQLYRRVADGDWEVSGELDLDAGAIRHLTRVGRRLATVLNDDSAAAQLAYVRPGQVMLLPEVSVPPGRWAVLGVDDGFRIVSRVTNEPATIQDIGPFAGEVSEAIAMTEHTLPAGKLWHMGLMLAVAVSAVLIVVLVRPSQKAVVQLPHRTGVLPAVPRLVALVIDLVPGGIIAVLVTGSSPAELLVLPMMTESFDHAATNLLMVAITVGHCTGSELVSGTTLGKLCVGGGIMAASGTRPSIAQVLLRNAVKLMVLLVPPLAIFALLNPYLQGFNDVVAGTVVLRHVDEPVEEEQGP